jgi:hypothetical protein
MALTKSMEGQAPSEVCLPTMIYQRHLSAGEKKCRPMKLVTHRGFSQAGDGRAEVGMMALAIGPAVTAALIHASRTA